MCKRWLSAVLSNPLRNKFVAMGTHPLLGKWILGHNKVRVEKENPDCMLGWRKLWLIDSPMTEEELKALLNSSIEPSKYVDCIEYSFKMFAEDVQYLNELPNI